jgi:hypothetical protein
MIVKIARKMLTGTALILLASVSPARCDGWNPFSSNKADQNAPKITNTSAQQSESTSVFGKIGTGTKNTWNKITGKKTEVTKKSSPGVVYPKNPMEQQAEKEPHSWLPWSKSDEKKPKSVKDYMKTSKRPEIQ